MRGSIHRSHACRVPGRLSPCVALSALVDGKTPVSLEGVDVLRAGGMGQGVSNGATEGFADFLSGRSVYLSTAALSAAGRKAGDAITLSAAVTRSSSHRRQAFLRAKAGTWRRWISPPPSGDSACSAVSSAWTSSSRPASASRGHARDPRGIATRRHRGGYRQPKRRVTTDFRPPIR